MTNEYQPQGADVTVTGNTDSADKALEEVTRLFEEFTSTVRGSKTAISEFNSLYSTLSNRLDNSIANEFTALHTAVKGLKKDAYKTAEDMASLIATVDVEGELELPDQLDRLAESIANLDQSFSQDLAKKLKDLGDVSRGGNLKKLSDQLGDLSDVINDMNEVDTSQFESNLADIGESVANLNSSLEGLTNLKNIDGLSTVVESIEGIGDISEILDDIDFYDLEEQLSSLTEVIAGLDNGLADLNNLGAVTSLSKLARGLKDVLNIHEEYIKKGKNVHVIIDQLSSSVVTLNSALEGLDNLTAVTSLSTLAKGFTDLSKVVNLFIEEGLDFKPTVSFLAGSIKELNEELSGLENLKAAGVLSTLSRGFRDVLNVLAEYKASGGELSDTIALLSSEVVKLNSDLNGLDNLKSANSMSVLSKGFRDVLAVLKEYETSGKNVADSISGLTTMIVDMNTQLSGLENLKSAGALSTLAKGFKDILSVFEEYATANTDIKTSVDELVGSLQVMDTALAGFENLKSSSALSTLAKGFSEILSAINEYKEQGLDIGDGLDYLILKVDDLNTSLGKMENLKTASVTSSLAKGFKDILQVMNEYTEQGLDIGDGLDYLILKIEDLDTALGSMQNLDKLDMLNNISKIPTSVLLEVSTNKSTDLYTNRDERERAIHEKKLEKEELDILSKRLAIQTKLNSLNDHSLRMEAMADVNKYKNLRDILKGFKSLSGVMTKSTGLSNTIQSAFNLAQSSRHQMQLAGGSDSQTHPPKQGGGTNIHYTHMNLKGAKGGSAGASAGAKAGATASKGAGASKIAAGAGRAAGTVARAGVPGLIAAGAIIGIAGIAMLLSKMMELGKKAYEAELKIANAQDILGESFQGAIGYAKEMNKELGVTESKTLALIATSAKLFKGAGLSSSSSTAMGKDLNVMAGQLSKAKGVDIDKIQEQLNQAVTSGSDSLGDYGISVDDNAIRMWADQEKGIVSMNTEISEAAMQVLRLKYIAEQYLALDWESAGPSNSTTARWMKLKNQMEDIGIKISTLFLPLFEGLVWIANLAVTAVHKLANGFIDLLNLGRDLVGLNPLAKISLDSGITEKKSTEIQNHFKDLKQLGDEYDKLKQNIFGFDEVINMTSYDPEIPDYESQLDLPAKQDKKSGPPLIPPGAAPPIPPNGLFPFALPALNPFAQWQKGFEKFKVGVQGALEKLRLPDWVSNPVPVMIPLLEPILTPVWEFVKGLLDGTITVKEIKLKLVEVFGEGAGVIETLIATGLLFTGNPIIQAIGLVWLGLEVLETVRNANLTWQTVIEFLGLEKLQHAFETAMNWLDDKIKDISAGARDIGDSISGWFSGIDFGKILDVALTILDVVGTIAILTGVGAGAGAAIRVGTTAVRGARLAGAVSKGAKAAGAVNKGAKASPGLKVLNGGKQGAKAGKKPDSEPVSGGAAAMKDNGNMWTDALNFLTPKLNSAPSYDSGGFALQPHIAQIGTAKGELALPLGSKAVEPAYKAIAAGINSYGDGGGPNIQVDVHLGERGAIIADERTFSQLTERMADGIEQHLRKTGALSYGNIR